LKDGELARRVAPPYPACRAEYFRDNIRQLYTRSKTEPPESALNKDYTDYFTKFGWRNGWIDPNLTMHTVPIKPDEGHVLARVIQLTTGFGPTRTEGDAELLRRLVTGDFIVRADADPAKLAAALERIFRKECELPVSLSVIEVEREVYVLSGKYEANPMPDRKKHQIEVFGFELTDRKTGGGGSGTLREMAHHIEDFIDSRVVIEAVTGAPRQVEWHYNYRSPFTEEQRAQDHNAEAVMKNIGLQTGLTARLEKRKIKVMVVKKAD
jgi:hypothetical protein